LINQAVVALGLGGPCAKDLGSPFLCVARENLPALPCENVMRATCFVHICILTGTNTSVSNYPG